MQNTIQEHSDREVELFQILKQVFGHQEFRFEQLNIINSLLNGHDTLAVMPTGGGKSLCYQLPALYLEGITLVVSPLISLMHDQVKNLEEYNIPAAFLNSSQSYQERKAVESDILNGKIKLLYVSPEGILSGPIIELLHRVKLSFIAIDEVHCVSQWGHEFRKDYTRLNELRDCFPSVPMIGLTATADDKTRQDVCHQLGMNDPNVFVSSFDRPNLKYMIFDRADEVKQLDQFIKENHAEAVGIVYCLSRKKVEKISGKLNELGYKAVPYHAGLSQQERSYAQDMFNTQDQIIVVATIAFGMGIDRPDVRFVAHLDLPKSIESYYQETGRAGRDGKNSSAWMIYGLQDVVKHSHMLETTDADEAYKRISRHKLDSMLSLCESLKCRRKHLLNYFGEELEEDCGFCDVCLEPVDCYNATTDAQKVLSTIYRTGQIFGSNYVIDVIRGSQNAKVLERGHDKLSVFGIGKEQPKNYWNYILRQLLALKYIYIKNWEYRNLALGSKCQMLLKGQEELELRKPLLNLRAKAEKKVKAKIIESSHGRDDLFEELRALRREISEDKKVPPYVVFADKTLHDMCYLLPRDKSEFLMVNGVGQSKLDKYGQAFMEKIREYS
jgi:ATP-dependent DNA helicase RecQ